MATEPTPDEIKAEIDRLNALTEEAADALEAEMGPDATVGDFVDEILTREWPRMRAILLMCVIDDAEGVPMSKDVRAWLAAQDERITSLVDLIDEDVAKAMWDQKHPEAANAISGEAVADIVSKSIRGPEVKP